MQLFSSSFDDGRPIPIQYTGDTSDFSPALAWEDPPENVKTFALICEGIDEPDGSRVHWLIYGIPGVVYQLSPKIPHMAKHASGLKQGLNAWGNPGYNGPRESEDVRRYVFTLYALDKNPKVDPEASREELEQGMKGHILATAQITGTYSG